MSKRIVTCTNCGKLFDLRQGGQYEERTRRYLCPDCLLCRPAAARQSAPVRRPSLGGAIAKIAFGLLFVVVSFESPEDGWTFGYFMTSLIVGCALIAWGLLPYLKAKRADAAAAREKETAAAQRTAAALPRDCPYCGAPNAGKRICEYCGRRLG